MKKSKLEEIQQLEIQALYVEIERLQADLEWHNELDLVFEKEVTALKELLKVLL